MVRELCAFLGMVGWCHLRISNYGLQVKTLYELLKTSQKDFIVWADGSWAAFLQVKQALMGAPALGYPDLMSLFELFTYERQNIALGVLLQFLGDQRRAVAYFSKQLDNVSQGWPSCL